MDKIEILEGLNEQQKLPAKHIYGPIYVIAAPGSGKTATSIRRIAYMIASGIDPHEILVFTFTRKAADEIKTRLSGYIGKQAYDVTVGTYHSICCRILRQYASRLGYSSNFTIYDTEDTRNLIKKIIDKDQFKPIQVIQAISAYKREGINPKQAIAKAENFYDLTLAQYYDKYQDELKKCSAMDFDDLISKCIELLKNHKDVQEKLHNQYKYIMVDEFQDSAATDIEFINLITPKSENLCVVFDDEQSIFGFRGSNIDAVLNSIDTQYSFTKYVLSRNYRSTQTIVKAARDVIVNNQKQVPKEVYTENEDGDPIILYEEESDILEANRVVKIVKGIVRSGNMRYTDIAILYRMQYLSRKVEEAFLKNGIPYEVVSGNPFYSRREIKDVLSYVRLLHNPYDRESFIRAIGIPKRGVGEKSIEKVILSQQTNETTIIEAASKAGLRGKAKSGVDQFLSVYKTLKEVYDHDPDPANLVREVVRITKYESILLEKDEDAEERIANLLELISIAAEYEDLDDFLSNLTLNCMAEDEESNEGGVKLITMHSSKGLEYPVVIIIGANEGITPHKLADTQARLEEERRLWYVAMTRAEKLLFIVRSKLLISQGQTFRANVSRFVDEISANYLFRFSSKQKKGAGGYKKIS